jgi:hypothetical protein
MPAYRIASPCSASWDEMSGDDRVRHCPQCRLDVYNFSEMTEPEIRQLVKARTGRLCARFYQRADGTMLTRNCPVSTPPSRPSLPAVVALSALLSSAPGTVFAGQQSFNDALTIAVQDVTGAVIPGATISFVRIGTGERFAGQTGENGELVTASIPRGEYDVTIIRAGFASYVLKDLTVPARVTAVVATLQVAVMGEIVEVPESPESGPIPSALLEPSQSNSQPPADAVSRLKPTQPAPRQNFFRRLFSKLFGSR